MEFFVIGTPGERQFRREELRPYLDKAKELPGSSILVPYYEFTRVLRDSEGIEGKRLEEYAQMLNGVSRRYGYNFAGYYNVAEGNLELHVVYDADLATEELPWDQESNDGN